MKNKKLPLVYIIMINWNGIKDTSECLGSLKKIKYKNYNIILIDNNSINNEALIIKNKYPQIILIKNSLNNGFCKANNQGIRLAIKKHADYILLLNNDTIVKSDFLTKLVEYAENNNYSGVLTPKILYYMNDYIWAMGGSLSVLTSIPRMIGQGRKSNDFNKIVEPDYASGCAFFVKAQILRKTGLFDEKYFAYYEDTDLSYRIKKHGFKILVIPKSIIWHKVSRSTNRTTTSKINSIQSYYLSRNGLIFGCKNLNPFLKVPYYFSQLFIKLPSYLLIKCADNQSRLSYIKGFFDGVKYII
jgi:GT2 family glycosyltransferase